MNTPEKKYSEYLMRAKRGEVRICGTSPFKLMNKRNDPLKAEEIEEERHEVQSVASDECVFQNENVEMKQMRLENAGLKVANRRLKKQIIKMHGRNADSKRDTSSGSANTVVGFTCEMCGRQFTFKSAMTRHVNGVHLKKAPHKCTACAYSTYQSTNLRTHMILAHDIVRKPNNRTQVDF